MANILKACKAFLAVLGGAEWPPKEKPQAPAPNREEEERKLAKEREARELNSRNQFEEGAIYTLILLQREGRLVDFLREDISAFDDGQVGAAVRQIHADCRKTLDEHFHPQPAIDASEGEKTTVPESSDPSEIKMTGNIPSAPPYQGTLNHKGWIATEVKLPTRTGKINPKVIQPAEVSF